MMRIAALRSSKLSCFCVCFCCAAPFYPLSAADDESLQKALAAFQSGEYDQALEHFKQAAKDKDPGQAFDADVGSARVLIEKGDYGQAETVIDQALEASPNHPVALTLKAKLQQITGRYEEARANYTKVLAVDPNHLEARLRLGVMQDEWGEKSTARRTLQPFISYYRSQPKINPKELSLVAQACIYLDRVRDANSLFYDATKQEPSLWQAYIPWGNLFLSKHNNADATGVFQDALKANPNAAEAHLGLAKASRQNDFKSVEKNAEKALSINPNLVGAHTLLAELDLALGDFEAALDKLGAALKINPNSLSARALRAVCFYFQKAGAKFADEEARVLAINPAYGELYFQLAEHLARRYLFKESVDYYRKALALDSDHLGAQAGLGTSLSRLGLEEEAIRELEKAFDKDPYNKYVGNLLTLFDEFPQYKSHTAGDVIVRIHERDDPVLSKYAVELVNEGWSSLASKYPMASPKPVLLEIFPEHDDFAVRCFGLPGAQAFLGICFGNIVAMDSPRARGKGDFVWGETLWHELVHVTHLRLTENRIPRWLAEGIAVYETSRAKPHWAMNMDLPFIQAFMNQRTLPLNELDSGFNRPTSPGQVSLSYYQASRVIEFIIARYGHNKLVETFPKFKEGLETDEVFKAIFRKGLAVLDEEFSAYIKEVYDFDNIDYSYDPHEYAALLEAGEVAVEEKLREKPNNPFVNCAAGLHYKKNGDVDRAIPALQRAKELFPNYVFGDNPYRTLADIYLEKEMKTQARQELEELTSRNGKDVGSLTLLANLTTELKEYARAITALRKVIYISPFEPDLHKKLATLYVSDGNLDEAITELQIHLNSGPQDLAGAHCELADVYLKAGKKEAAKTSALAALEIAPNYDKAQEILLACLE